jgi:hypothetical protein
MPVASLTRLSPSRIVTMRRGTPRRWATEVAAMASVGETMGSSYSTAPTRTTSSHTLICSAPARLIEVPDLAHAIQLRQSLPQILCRGQREELTPSYFREPEAHQRVGHSKVANHLYYGRPLGPRTLQEGPSGSHIVEVPFDQNRGPLRMGDRRELRRSSAIHRDLCAGALAGCGAQGERRDAGYGR